jgi:hypothetical protein
VGNDLEGRWQRKLIEYLKINQLSALVWSLNPGWDTGGVLSADWHSVELDKQEAYRQMLAPPLDNGPLGVFGRAPTRLKILFRQDQGPQSNRISFAFRIVNDGPETLDLSHLEFRYWFRIGSALDLLQLGGIGLSYQGISRILAEFVPTGFGDQDHFIRIRFPANAGKIERYQMSEEISVQTPEIGGTASSLLDDYSFPTVLSLRERFGEWDRVTLYFNGQLVWGREPQP